MSGATGRGGQNGSPFIHSSGKWLAIVIAGVASVFVTPDLWRSFEPLIIENILARYQGGLAEAIYWALRLAAYPLVFFAVRMTLGVVFVTLVMGVVMKLFGGRR